MAGKRTVFFGIPAALGLILVTACSLLPGNLEDGVIKLNVYAGTEARAVEVKDYDVETLDLEIYGPDPENPGNETLIWTEVWTAPDPESYLVQGIGAGTYRIVVTHNGVNGDENLSVAEEATFEVAVMKITSICVIPGLLGVLDVEGDVPQDIDGFWTASWEAGDLTLSPLYTHIQQTGSDFAMPYGFGGYVAGNTVVMTGELDEGTFSAVHEIVDGNEFSGPFTIEGENPEPPPDTFVIEGISTFVRTDPSLFGHLDVSGLAVGTSMSLDTDAEIGGAMAHFYEEEVYDDDTDEYLYDQESLRVSYLTVDCDISLDFAINTADGSFLGGGSFAVPFPVDLIVRYVVDGSGFGDSDDEGEEPEFTGILQIDELISGEGGHVAGSFTTDPGSVDSMTAHFDVPLSLPPAM